MQDKSKETLQFIKKLGKLVKKLRKTRTDLSCRKFDYSFELGGNLNRIENGKINTSITVVYKIAESLGMKFSDFAKLLEDELGEDFTLIDK